MASFDPVDSFDPHLPPPRPTTPPVRRGFLLVLGILLVVTSLAYGIPYAFERAGYAYESGRARALDKELKGLDDAGVLNRASSLFRLAAARVAPAVVNIRGLRRGAARGAPVEGRAGASLDLSSGSGVVVDLARGFVVTNHHVVKDADEVVVRTQSGSEYSAQLVGSDAKTDLAVLRVQAPFKVAAEWGDSEKLEVGEWVLAIGSPYMLDQTVTAGIVSATRRNNIPMLDREQYQDFVQTDAAVNPGNSGGPLIDLRGRVVGINTAIFTPNAESGGSVGIGLAISATMARRVADQLIANGRVSRGFLGVGFEELTARAAGDLGLPAGTRGVVVRHVEPGGPAELAGLKPGDVLVGFGGEPVADGPGLRNKIAGLAAGSAVPLKYLRDGKESVAEARIVEWPLLATLGLHVRDLAGEPASAFPEGPARVVVIDRVMPNSEAQRAGLVPGMRVVAVGDRPVSTKAECDALANALDPAAGVPLQVQVPDGRTAPIVLGGGRGPRR